MAGQEHHLHPPKAAEAQGIGGCPEGSVHHQLLHHLQAFHGIEATATEYAQTGNAEVGAGGGTGHAVSLLRLLRSTEPLQGRWPSGVKPILVWFAEHP